MQQPESRAARRGWSARLRAVPARGCAFLGGGGITGIAWELGILKGLADAGVDLSHADLVVGTSAGSVVGAQLTSGRSLEELYASQLAPADKEIGARL